MPNPRLRAVGAVLLFAVACGEPVGPEDVAVQATATGPTLLVCSGGGGDAAEASIGPVGGSVALNRSRVDLPDGALDALRKVRVRTPASDIVEIRVTVGDQEHFEFDAPVRISIDYSRCTRDLSDVALTVWEIDPETKAPLEYMGGIDDKSDRVVTFTTTHLSGYSLAE